MPLLILLIGIPVGIFWVRNRRGLNLKRRLKKLGQLEGRSRAQIESVLKTPPRRIQHVPDGTYGVVYGEAKFAFCLVYYSNDICKGILQDSVTDQTMRPLVQIETPPMAPPTSPQPENVQEAINEDTRTKHLKPLHIVKDPPPRPDV